MVLNRRIAKEVVSRKLQRIRKKKKKHSQNSLSQAGKSFSLLSSLHRSNLEKCVQDFHANWENILKIRYNKWDNGRLEETNKKHPKTRTAD